MPLVISDQGIAKRLTGIRSALGLTCQLGLFNSNITPSRTDVATTYTAHEATFGGYSRATLNSWGAITVVLHVAAMQEIVRTFTRTGGATETIYGYFVLDNLGALMWAEAFPGGGIVMSGVGQMIAILPGLTDESKFG